MSWGAGAHAAMVGWNCMTEVARLPSPCVMGLNKVNMYIEPIGCCWYSLMTLKWLSCQGGFFMEATSCS